MARKAFNFYRSYWEQIKLLNSKQQLLLFKAICEVQFLEKHIEDIAFNDKVLEIIWVGIKHSINTSLQGYITKQKGLGTQVIEPLAKGGGKGVQNPPASQGQEEGQEEVQGKGKVQKKKYAEFVFMHEKEYNTLVSRYKKEGTKQCIEVLNNYKGSNGKKYRSDYSAILSWVVEKLKLQDVSVTRNIKFQC